METTSSNHNTENKNQDALFGVSSDDIIQALHNGELRDELMGSSPERDQIVNAQDQLDIVNPAEDDTETTMPHPVASDSPTEKPLDIAEREKIPGDKEISGQQQKSTKPDLSAGIMD